MNAGKFLGYVMVWAICTLISSMGVGNILFALKWDMISTMPSAIAITIVPLAVAVALTYFIAKID
ncbi:hypothetical protein [Bacillus phage vB_BanS-Thrax3]|nr:hypothetical protein [Bacillus phage vB_BanS-Thrax3]